MAGAGYIDLWYRKYTYADTCASTRGTRPAQSQTALSDVVFVFVFFGIGIGAAALCFLFEHALKAMQGKAVESRSALADSQQINNSSTASPFKNTNTHLSAF